MPLDLGMDPKTEKFNSALYWLPRITKAGLHVPPTETIRVSADFVWRVLGEEPADEETSRTDGATWKSITDACARVGWPVFIRTDNGSAKHRGPSAYRAANLRELGDVVLETLEHDVENDIVGERWPNAILVRKWLDLNGDFTAFDGHRIAREFRFFAEADRVICHHFYWPEEALEFREHDHPPQDWKNRLALARVVLTDAVEKMRENARSAARACPEHPKWSVDFAEDVDGAWWLIDMAIAERSWHPENCPGYQETQRTKTSK